MWGLCNVIRGRREEKTKLVGGVTRRVGHFFCAYMHLIMRRENQQTSDIIRNDKKKIHLFYMDDLFHIQADQNLYV